MTLDFSRCRLEPFHHQREDTAALIRHPYFFITSEMRTGKSKIVVDGIQFLFEMNLIDRVIVVAPQPVRDVWFDQEFGEFAKHLWLSTPAAITEFHSKVRTWHHGSLNPRFLDIYVTNYEFLRAKARVEELLPVCGTRTMLVLDESSYVKNWSAQQTKACVELRKACARVVLLNGTPIFHSPLDLFSQGNLLHPSILQCPYITHYKARYAIQSPVLGAGGRVLKTPHGRAIEKITGWTNLEDLQRRFAPITVRRLQKDCLDLPPKLDPVVLTATLKESWPAYKDMRDDMVVWLQSGDVASSTTAATRVMRLAQITSGFVGGIEDARIDITVHQDEERQYIDTVSEHLASIAEVGREKLDVLLWFLEQKLEADPNLHVVVWCRFRAELFRMLNVVKQKFPQFNMGSIHGLQKKEDRREALMLLKPDTAPSGPVFVGGTAGTGSFGLDFSSAHTCVTMSSGYSTGQSAQMLDRVYGPGQKHPIAYYDIVATGPKGERTIDHAILGIRRAGQDVATLTADAWVRALTA